MVIGEPRSRLDFDKNSTKLFLFILIRILNRHSRALEAAVVASDCRCPCCVVPVRPTAGALARVRAHGGAELAWPGSRKWRRAS